MAIVDDLKGRMNEALRAKDEVAKNIYRLAYSEMQLASARSGKDVNDDEAMAILKKLVKSNEETLANADLIAAAPELYEALADLVAVIGEIRCDPTAPIATMFHAAQSALAKARGENPHA